MQTHLSTRFSPSLDFVPQPAQAPCLLVRIYPASGLEPPIELTSEPQLIGRDSQCSISLPDDSVSRRHAAIEFMGGRHVVRDLGSTNGTFVNDERVETSRVLEASDRVRFGGRIFKYLSSDGVESQYHEVMFKLMTTDGLTSVYNKRYFMETLEHETIQAERSRAPLALMLMDLDRFKAINDTHGHLAGDAVLVEFANRARKQLRSGEVLARYGGEEFVLLAPRTSLAEAKIAAERVRALTAAQPVVFDGKEIPITVSIGLHVYQGDRSIATSDLLAAADELLYVAKNSGRNQVRFEKGSPE